MKFRILIVLQIVSLLATLVLGTVLNEDLIDGPRDLHRLSGSLSGAFGIVAVTFAFYRHLSTKTKVLVSASTLFTFIAAASGISLASADNYDLAYNVMRRSGTTRDFVITRLGRFT